MVRLEVSSRCIRMSLQQTLLMEQYNSTSSVAAVSTAQTYSHRKATNQCYCQYTTQYIICFVFCSIPLSICITEIDIARPLFLLF